MNDTLLLYLFTRLDAIKGFSTLALLLEGAGVIILVIGIATSLDDSYSNESEVEHNRSLRERLMITLRRLCIYALLPTIVISILVPSQKDALFIVAGTGLLEIAKSEQAGRIASKAVNVFEDYLDKIGE